MTNEEKVKAYDEALERAKRLHREPTGGTERIVCEQIFPELNESEDERIKKAIIATIHLYYGEPLENEAKDMLSWLEKQGKKTPQWMIDFLENHRKNFGISMDYDERREVDGKLFSILKWLKGNPQIEQNPAWSEEDEYCRNQLIIFCENCMVHDSNAIKCANWLKLLKDKIQKPFGEKGGEE